MVLCFVFGCNCNDVFLHVKCSFFRFPTDKSKAKKWEQLCRRKDRSLKPHDRICSCHFKDGNKQHGPTLFPWNEGKAFDFPEVVAIKRKRRAATSSASSSTAVSADPQPGPALPDVGEVGQSGACDASPGDVWAPVNMDHTYNYACNTESCQQRLKHMQDKILNLQESITDLEGKISTMSAKRAFTINDIKDDDEKMLLYTSLTYDVFIILVRALHRFKLTYYYGWKVGSLTLDDQLLMTLMKLRLNLKDMDLAERFNLSRFAVANIFYTFVHALHEILFVGIMEHKLPSQLKCKGSLPQSFADFDSARVVIDATELTQDVPSNLNQQSSCYSSYKSRHTVKAVTGVAPNGALVFSSSLYPGSTSDVAIVEHSKFLDLLEPGDLILADKGFTLFDRLPRGVSLNIPPFLAGKAHFTKQEAELCTKIGRSRIHIERANERTKNFEILRHIPSHYRRISTKIFQLCSCLINLQATLIKEIADKYTL